MKAVVKRRQAESHKGKVKEKKNNSTPFIDYKKKLINTVVIF